MSILAVPVLANVKIRAGHAAPSLFAVLDFPLAEIAAKAWQRNFDDRRDCEGRLELSQAREYRDLLFVAHLKVV
jgi:hypothetical protein